VDYLDLLTVMPTVTGLLGLLLGLVVGSFLNVVIIRLPPRLAYQWQPAEAVSDPSQVSAIRVQLKIRAGTSTELTPKRHMTASVTAAVNASIAG